MPFNKDQLNPVNSYPAQETVDEDTRKARQTYEDLISIRAASLENLTKKVNELEDSRDLTSEHFGNKEATVVVRDIRSAVVNLKALTEAQDKLFDMVINDMLGLVATMDDTMMGMNRMSVMLQGITELMLSKSLITKDELKAAQTKVIVGINEAHKRQTESLDNQEPS